MPKFDPKGDVAQSFDRTPGRWLVEIPETVTIGKDATPRSARVGSGTTAGKSYTVPMVGRVPLSCGCADHRYHASDRCKHMISAEQIAAASPGPLPCIVAPRSRPRKSA
jgi:hypothetical protein